MAKNDQDKSGRSLEEQLASLDAMSNEQPPQRDEDDAERTAADNPWRATPPAPTFPPPPEQLNEEGSGYPGAGKPPQFPGAPAQDQPEEFYPATEFSQSPGAESNGGGPWQPADSAPAEQRPQTEEPEDDDARAEDTVAGPGYGAPGEGRHEGGGFPAYQAYQGQEYQGQQYASPHQTPFPGQQQYPQPQFGPQFPTQHPEQPPYSEQHYTDSPPQYAEQPHYQDQQYAPPPGRPHPQQAHQYAPPPEHPGYPSRPPQQYGPPPEQQWPSPPPETAQGPPLTPLPEAYQQQIPQQSADSLSADALLRGKRYAPAAGWRRALFKASGGLIHPGESPTELRRRELLARARTPVAGGHHRVAVMSLKGGVGKTTTTVGLGATLASLRGDRVIAVDANPDRGTLSDKVRLETATTVRDLLNEHEHIQRYADVRAYTSQSSSRLEVLASDRDPAVSEAFSEDDFRTVAHVLEHFYSICITDCGTGLLHSAMAGVLGLANQLVLVSSPSVDGARSASATLDWLEAHHYGDLVRNGVVVLSMVRPRSKSTVDLDRLQAHFESRCRAVVRIPYDGHLEEGAEVELDLLSPATQDAYIALAATVGDGFAWPH